MPIRQYLPQLRERCLMEMTAALEATSKQAAEDMPELATSGHQPAAYPEGA